MKKYLVLVLPFLLGYALTCEPCDTLQERARETIEWHKIALEKQLGRCELAIRGHPAWLEKERAKIPQNAELIKEIEDRIVGAQQRALELKEKLSTWDFEAEVEKYKQMLQAKSLAPKE